MAAVAVHDEHAHLGLQIPQAQRRVLCGHGQVTMHVSLSLGQSVTRQKQLQVALSAMRQSNSKKHPAGREDEAGARGVDRNVVDGIPMALRSLLQA